MKTLKNICNGPPFFSKTYSKLNLWNFSRYFIASAEPWMLRCCGTSILTLQMMSKYKNWRLMYISATTWLWLFYWKRVLNTLSLIACLTLNLVTAQKKFCTGNVSLYEWKASISLKNFEGMAFSSVFYRIKENEFTLIERDCAID